MRYMLVIASIVCFTITSYAQESIHWMTFAEAIKAQKLEQRKIFVDMYTDWCGWCKRMDATTFKNDKVIRRLNTEYYPVKFNAEIDKEITFNGKEYKLVQRGRRRYHELAMKFVKKSNTPYLSYPTYVFIDENLDVIQPIRGYQKTEELLPILDYFAYDYYKKQSWNQFKRNYDSEKFRKEHNSAQN